MKLKSNVSRESCDCSIRRGGADKVFRTEGKRKTLKQKSRNLIEFVRCLILIYMQINRQSFSDGKFHALYNFPLTHKTFHLKVYSRMKRKPSCAAQLSSHSAQPSKSDTRFFSTLNYKFTKMD